MARRPPVPEYGVDEVIERLRHAKRRLIQAITWARALNEAWRTLNRHGSRVQVALSPATAAASVYERATLDTQIMMVARVFDTAGRDHALKSNRMSLPICADLLALPGVMDQLLDQSEQWNEMGRENRDPVMDRHRRLVDGLATLLAEDPNRISLIRGFRDENIAHELHFDELPQRPQYDHIHGLVEQASTLVSNLAFVVSGENVRWEDGGVAASTEWLWDAVAREDFAGAE